MGAQKSGVEAVVEMFRKLDTPTRERLMKDLEAKDPALLDVIQKNLFEFKSLWEVSREQFYPFFREFDLKQWCLAFRGTPEAELQELTQRLPRRVQDELWEQFQQIGPQPLSKVEEARSEICQKAERWRQEGKIALSSDQDEWV